MRLRYSSPLLFLLLLVGCSNANHGTEIPEGRLELVWAVLPEGSEEAQLEEPWFARIMSATVSNNDIYVADRMRAQVLQLNSTGQFVRAIGGRGNGPGEFESGPRRVSISNSGQLFFQDAFRDFNRYTPDGQFLKKFSQDYPSTETRVGSPFAFDDSTIVWDVSPRTNLESGVDGYLDIPLLIAIQEAKSIPFGKRYLSEQELTTMNSLINRNLRDERIQCMNFSQGMTIKGQNEDEVLFIKDGSPYEVHRFHLNQSHTFFTFYEPIRDKWIKELQLPSEEFREMAWTYRFKYRGPKQNQIENVTNMFSFTHWLRGIALQSNKLTILVEILTEDFQPNAIEGAIEQFVYLIDLNDERAVMRAKLDPPIPQLELQGALEDGTLIFSTNDPVPGILAYRIVPN